MTRRRPARRSADQEPKDPSVEPVAGFLYLREIGPQGQPLRSPIRRVVRQGTHDHGQGSVWTIEVERPAVAEDGRPYTAKALGCIMYDRHRREWADALIVLNEALKRGEPIHAVEGKTPPLGPVP